MACSETPYHTLSTNVAGWMSERMAANRGCAGSLLNVAGVTPAGARDAAARRACLLFAAPAPAAELATTAPAVPICCSVNRAYLSEHDVIKSTC